MVSEQGSQDTPHAEKPKDIFRDYPVRYLGYANELGEAFRSFVHLNWVRTSYGVASCYVIADATHKGQIAYEKFQNHPMRNRLTAQGVVDTLLWQGLASVAVPGFTINRVCWLSNKIFQSTQRVPSTTGKAISTAIGLAAIPIIISPIDNFVDLLMENTFRKWFDHVEEFERKEIVHHHRDD